MADDLCLGIAIVDRRFKNLHSFSRDGGASQTADKLLALTGKHRTADRFHPTAVRNQDIVQCGIIAFLRLQNVQGSVRLPFGRRLVFAERIIEPEALDQSPPDIAKRNLADLVRINRRFGGHATILKLLAAANVPRCRFTVLDVGAASGDTAQVIRRAYSAVCVYNLDLHPVNLSAADHPKVVGDAFRLPFADGSIDYVICSLFLHHFRDGQVVQLLREFYRVSSRGVLIADLERSLWPYLFIGYSGPLFGWGKITVDDGKKSVRAGFRRSELEALAKQAGLNKIYVEEHRPAFRLTLVAAKQNGAGV